MPVKKSSSPLEGLPVYRPLTGPDDATFCRRVSDAIAQGYLLYGSPAATLSCSSNCVRSMLVLVRVVVGHVLSSSEATILRPAFSIRGLAASSPVTFKRFSAHKLLDVAAPHVGPSGINLPAMHLQLIANVCS